MKIEKVSANIKYSKDIGGSWKSIELAAEGSIEAKENWQQAQSYLYGQLGQQMKTLWANGNGAAANGHNGAESHGDEPAGQEPGQSSREGLEHWCDEHRAEFHQRTGKDGESWWSHKAPDGGWCRE